MKKHLIASVVVGVLAGVTGAAAQEKVVNVYNWSDYIDPSILEDFTKATGIKVKYDVFDSNELLETKLLAGKTGYDVVVPSGNFLARQIKTGVFLPLDKAKLPNLTHMWPLVTKTLGTYDPDNKYAVNYMWGTTGIGYNVEKIKQIMPDAPLDSWKLVFDPQYVMKFKSCGVMMLDAPDEIVPAVMNYLGLDPNSKKTEDLKKAAEHFKQIRPAVRKFHSSEYINALANGEVCLVVGWSGDIKQAASRAEEKKPSPGHIGYIIPKEGAYMFFDNFAIPKDAKNIEEAYTFINYMLQPEVIAKATNFVKYPSGNLAAQKLVDKAILDDRSIYPSEETMAKLYVITPFDQKSQRELTAVWREMKKK